MATFYILPPRPVLDEALSGVLSRFLPGLPFPSESWDSLVSQMASAADWPTDLFLIPRDELPDDHPLADALMNGFGAEPGDRIVEVAARSGSRVWTLEQPSVSVPVEAR